MVKYCTNCGMQLPDESQFCTNCGATLTHPVQPVQPVYNIPYKPQNKLITIKGIKQIVIFYTISFLCISIILFFNLVVKEYNPVYDLLGFLWLFSLLGIYIGVRKVYIGIKEFGFNHEKSVNIAKKLITWGIIIIIFFFILPHLIRTFFATHIISTFVMIPFWLALVYLIKELTIDRIRKLLWIAFFSRFLLVLLNEVSYPILTEFYDTIYLEYFAILSIVAIIPSLLYIYCYYNTYKILKIKNFQQIFKKERFQI